MAGPVHDEWPSTRWALSAPASRALLRAPVPPGGVEPLTLALKELVVRGAVRLERVKRPGRVARGRDAAAVRVVPGAPGVDAVLRPALDLVGGLRRRELVRADGSGDRVHAVLLDDLASLSERRREAYRDDHVLPALERHGLATIRTLRVLGVVVRQRAALTERGFEAQDELRRWLEVGEDRVSGWAASDPARALAFAGGAGAALLLMPEVHRELHVLYHRDAVGDGGVADGAWPGSRAREGDEPRDALDEWSEAGTFGLGDGWLDASGFDRMDLAWGAIDAAVGGGGGDGGGAGGDGGSGG